RLRLLDRDGNIFFVLGETGNVYTVMLCRIPSCNCPYWHTPCKHILFVFLRILRMIPRDDRLEVKVLKDALQSKILDDCQVGRISNMGSLTRSFAGDRVRKRFFYLRRALSTVSPPQKIQLEIGVKYPYCEGDLNDVDKSNPVVECEACGEAGHESCLVTFKLRQEGGSCSTCKAHWSAVADENKYLNLAVYVENEEDDPVSKMKTETMLEPV
ncbi:hypothetical protein MKW94_028868, partial [Papaver nudicaule]|nr:hypothetical protein [Papaver nudicaule]